MHSLPNTQTDTPINHALIAAAFLVRRGLDTGAYPTVADAVAALASDGATLDYTYPGIPDGHWIRARWYLAPDDVPMLIALLGAIDQGHEENVSLWAAALELAV